MTSSGERERARERKGETKIKTTLIVGSSNGQENEISGGNRHNHTLQPSPKFINKLIRPALEYRIFE